MDATLTSGTREREEDAARVVAALRRVGEIWEARLASGWNPPEGSTFPWAQVRLSLAALVPGLLGSGEWLKGDLTPQAPLSREERANRERGEHAAVMDARLSNNVVSVPPPLPRGTSEPGEGGWGGEVPLAALILAGNTPLMAWSPLCACLLAGWRVRVKMSREETLWPRLFWEALRESDAEVAARVVLDVWAGEDQRTATLVQGADAVIVFGGDRTIATVRAQTPSETPFFGFGHAVSLGLLLPGYTWDEWRGFARDVLMYGQGGCLSPHVLLESPDVAGDGTGIYGGKEFAWQMLQEADALEVAPITDPAVARALREARGLAAFEGLEAIGFDTGWEELRFLVVCDYQEMPEILPTPVGHGTVYLVPGDPLLLPERLGPLRGRVSCVGVAGPLPEPVRALLATEGVSRICPAGEMQTPPLDWPNGNIDLLTALSGIKAPGSAGGG